MTQSSNFQSQTSNIAGGSLRIGYVIWSLGLGGAEQVVARLASALDRQRFEPVIFCLNEAGVFAPQATQAGIEVVALQKRGPVDFVALVRLARLLRRHRIQVLHTHLWGANLWGRVAARLAGVPVVIATEHNGDTWKRWYHFAMDRWLAGRTTQLVAVSQQVSAFYEAHGIGRGRWHVIYNGVEAGSARSRERGAAYKALGLGTAEPVVGWVGRLVPAKAPEVFVEAVAEAARSLPAMKVLIIGDGPLRSDVEAQVRRQGLERVIRFTGVRQDIPELLAGLDALVFSSEREGLSMAMLEAMAAGVPVIATRVGGTPELIESGVTGILVEPGRPRDLAQRLVELLKSPEQAQKIREAARARVQRDFSLEAMVDAHEALYRSTAPCPVPLSPCPHKIVYVIDDLARGGAQRQLVELVKALPRDGYELSVISLSTTKIDYAQAIRDAGVPLQLIAQTGAWSWSAFWWLLRALRAERPAIVQTWLFTADLYGRLAARLTRVPVVISTVRSIEPSKPRHYVAADRLLRHLTDAFAVNARAVGEMLTRREHVAASKIQTIYNGVDLRAFDPHRMDGTLHRELGVSVDTPLIGVVGRLAPEKDYAAFLRAAAMVARQDSRVRFVIVGGGPLREDLERLAGELGLNGRVQFLGSRPEIEPVMASLNVVVVSSVYEGCSNVILEAMAMGKPVIATDVGGNPELVIPGATGWLVPVGQPEALAEAMLAVLREPATAAAMGEAGRRRIEERFTLERTVQETTSLYRQLLTLADVRIRRRP